MTTITAKELRAGDWITVKDGSVYFHRVPIDRSQEFTAWFMPPNGSLAGSGSVTYQPDELVELIDRWPWRPGR